MHRQPTFPRLDPSEPFAPAEEAILDLWAREQVFEASLERPAPRGPFVFYEGPPTANNVPHVGHVLTRVVKDLFPRYRTMRGHRVLRQAGWDTHGLPVELAIEKELGFTGKADIEEYGVERFNARCFESVRRYEQEWVKVSNRIGFWLDYPGAYFTFTNRYVESVWWLLKQMWDRDLMYRGYKVLPYCPLCATTHSSHEVAQNYRDVQDPSVWVKFRLRPGQRLPVQGGGTFETTAATFAVAWTTTPWTLPSNVALAVHPGAAYRLVRSADGGDDLLLVADGLSQPVLQPVERGGKRVDVDLRGEPEVARFAGADLEGVRYEPLYDFFAGVESPSPGWVIAADGYVSLDDGTGIVHNAPAFGEDDYRVCTSRGLPFFAALGADGRFRPEVEPWAGKWFKDADPDIVTDLKRRGLLLRSQKLDHPYPHCWRHDTPLYYSASDSWFVRTTAVKDDLIAGNRTIRWRPEHIGEGRFGKWLDGVVDWALSRKRYWGTPLPAWICGSCERIEVVGSYAQLFARAGRPMPEDPYDPEVFNPHRPWIDEFTFACTECSGTMRRAVEVIDCWFDAGAMPFAQVHYPFENREAIDEGTRFPADFISEAVDQTRGWFYTLHVISTIVTGRPAYRACIVLGHVLDEQGRKMSKRLGNVIDPREIVPEYGADAVRWYFYTTNPTQPSRFGRNLLRESVKEFLLPLWNAASFFTIYANVDGWRPDSDGSSPFPEVLDPRRRPALDRWILGRLSETVQEVTAALEDFRVGEAARPIQAFVDQLTQWYIRRSRARFWAAEDSAEKRAAFRTLWEVLGTLSRLLAPFIPFASERLHQGLVRPFGGADGPVSVHLCDWPEPDPRVADPGLARAMADVLRVVSLGHAARARTPFPTRRPLDRAVVVSLDEGLESRLAPYIHLVLDELNVEGLEFARDRNLWVDLRVKPNFRVLGKRLGRRMPEVAEAISRLAPGEIVAEVEAGRPVVLRLPGGDVEIAATEIEVQIADREGAVTASEGGVLVALPLGESEEVRRRLDLKWFAREAVNRIAGLRKDLELEYTRRVRVGYSGGGGMVAALAEHRAWIAGEILAASFGEIGTPEGDRAVDAGRGRRLDAVVQDEALTLWVTPVDDRGEG